MSAPVRQRVVVVSDLHMAVPDGPIRDPFGEDAAFASLLDALASGPPIHLVLLGDTFDLVLAAGASAGLDAIAAAHPSVFRALELGLPRDVLLEVDRRATPTPLAVAVRLRARRGNFMLEAARGESGVLAQAGAPTAFYVFGHTHVAEDRLRFIEIEHGAGRPATARLRRWQRT